MTEVRKILCREKFSIRLIPLMKFTPLIFFVLLFTQHSIAQTPVIDSLKKILAAAPNDTSKIRLLNRIAEDGEDTIMLNNAKRALQKLQSLPVSFQNENKKYFLTQQATSYYWVSNYFNSYTNDADSGMIYLHRTLVAALENNDSMNISLVYNDFAVLTAYKGVDSSLYWMNKSLPFTIATKDSSQIATANNNIAYIYIEKG